jgi:hypothetical protein
MLLNTAHHYPEFINSDRENERLAITPGEGPYNDMS